MSKLVSPILYDEYEPDIFTDGDESSPENSERIQKQNEEKPAPVDKYRFVHITFYLLGTSIMLPWFFFVTCNDYWMYRFRTLPNNSSSLYLLKIFTDSGANRTTLQADFTSYISIAATVPSTVFLFFNLFYLRKFSIHWRIVVSSVIVFLFFAETTVLVLFNSDSWQFFFFVVTLTTVIILNLSTAILQSALCGLFMKFPVAYISASSSGQSLAGVFAAAAQIITLAINGSPTRSTFLYFIFADVIILSSFVGYLCIRRTEFFKYYVQVSSGQSSPVSYQRLHNSETNPATLSVNYYAVFQKTWTLTSSVFCCYVVTCSIYPSIAVLVCSESLGVKSAWSDEYFVPVITYLLYCICEYSGRIVAGIVQTPKDSKLVWISLVRIVFVPLLLFCNAQPRHNLPVIIDSDLLYSIIIIALAFSNGYISTLTLILVPRSVHAHEQEVACTMLIIWLAAGLSLGSLLSFPLVNLL